MTHRNEAVKLDPTIEATIVQLVAAIFGKKRRPPGLDDPLFSTREYFDSFALLELVVQLEDTFGIRIPDDELDPDYFQSVGTLSTYVRSKLGKPAVSCHHDADHDADQHVDNSRSDQVCDTLQPDY